MASTLETASYGHIIHCNFDAEVCVVLVRFVECNVRGVSIEATPQFNL